MQQFVYILEVARGQGYVRVHYAQTVGAAQRAVRRHGAGGVWTPTGDPRTPARLLDGEVELARVVREVVRYE